MPHVPQAVLDAFAKVIDTGEAVTGVHTDGPAQEDGTPTTFTAAYYPVKQDGAVVAVWATVIEVTSADLARERGILREVIERAPAPMAVMWGEELVFTYVNAHAMGLLGENELIGRRAADVFPAGEELAADLRETVLERGEPAEVKQVPVADRYWTVSCVAVPGLDGRPGGVLAVGHETTEETTDRRQLEADLADEHRIATQLQVSLMPDRLPAIPGMDLASGFRPAGYGHEIGGDFYDVFQIADGCWMVVIGDVCGKGAEAASLTALARYTLRAAAIRDGAEPATLLRQLNEAILRQRDDMRFLSVVCMFLDLDEDGGVGVRTSVAGHLPPLLVRDEGGVEPIEGGAGPVLGVWESPDLAEQHMRIEPGSRIVLYTDGVLDARQVGELTERGLAELLAGLGEGDAASTVAGIENSVIGPDEQGRDDMAVLVLRPLGGS